MHNLPILSSLILVPAVGSILLMFLDSRHKRELRQGALAISCITFALSVVMLLQYQDALARSETPGLMQLVELNRWFPSLGVSYHVGVDGINILLVLLTTFLTPIIQLSAWRAIEDRLKEFQICLLLLECGMIGTFLALDMILFYVFWEVMLVPMYLIIGVWGGERRIYAAIKFFIYTMVGSLLMFLAILYLWYQTGSFDLLEVTAALRGQSPLSVTAQCWLFAAFALSFAIKVPMFPFHTWLPDAHVEAPTAGSVVLAGVLLKMGTYGFIRFAMPLFPAAVAVFLPWIMALSIIGILFGALMARMQTDIKKLVAYSSVSHLGFVMVGLFVRNPSGVTGGMLQMINHGLSTGMLFLLVGIIYERRHTRELANYGGLAQIVPVYSVFFMIATLSSIGLPGLNGFVGEFLVLQGAFAANWVYAALAGIGVILGAIYMLYLVKGFLFGPIVHEENRGIADLTAREWLYLSPIVVLMVWIGLYPKPFQALIEPTILHYLRDLLAT